MVLKKQLDRIRKEKQGKDINQISPLQCGEQLPQSHFIPHSHSNVNQPQSYYHNPESIHLGQQFIHPAHGQYYSQSSPHTQVESPHAIHHPQQYSSPQLRNSQPDQYNQSQFHRFPQLYGHSQPHSPNNERVFQNLNQHTLRTASPQSSPQYQVFHSNTASPNRQGKPGSNYPLGSP